jgi:uncharacterized protein (TIGR02722 family)
MKTSKHLLAAASLIAILGAGCGSQSVYVDPKGTRTVTTLGDINIQDWGNAAETMIASLRDSGVIEKAPNKPAIMAISRIVNNTSQQIDIDLLVKKIRVALSKDGKVLTTTTLRLGGAEDPLAKDLQEEREALGEKAATRKPDFTLSGKIIENYVRAGSTRQYSYIFQLSLTDHNGLAVWEEEKTITKQGKKATVGF